MIVEYRRGKRINARIRLGQYNLDLAARGHNKIPASLNPVIFASDHVDDSDHFR